MNPPHRFSDLHLVVVDVQHDFAHPDGALFVAGGDTAARNIAGLMNSGCVERVTFTLDWHPFDHCSFQEEGGTWPRHCVEHSHGAALHGDLFTQNFAQLDKRFYTKGTRRDEEEYGAFARLTPDDREWLLSGRTVLCGIAGDYCVLETLKNLREVCPHVALFAEGIASIDDGTALRGYADAHDIPTLTFSDLMQ